ncbi:MAG TPA: GAF domain-containing sensor histidine kinase [Anaerolineae bacterium]|nr:GAF domain-containing sensor histidine kinase [Anaerolineae bacterium]
MNPREARITPEAKEGVQLNTFPLDWLVSNLRWIWLLLIALFVAMDSLLSVERPAYFTTLVIIVGVGLALNGMYAGLLWAKFFPNWLAIIATVLDMTLAIALLVILNRHAQLLLPIMVFPVLMAGLRWNAEIGLLIALPIALSYGVSLVPLLGEEIDRVKLINALLTAVANALVLFIAGGLPGPFIRQQIDLAEQANEIELKGLRIANERGKLISEMALTLGSTLNYRKVLRTMIDLAFSAMAEVGTKDESTIAMVLLFDGDSENGTERLRVAAGRNIGRSDEGRRVSSEEGLIGRTIRTAEATITHNVQKDRVLTSFASIPGCRSAICAPLRAGLNTYGVVLFCSTESNFYNEEHKQLLTTFCSQAIITLQNAQLFEDLQYEQQKILEKEAEARRKLARDLHDGPTQSIAAIAMRLNFIKMVLQKEDVAKAYEEVVKVEEIAQRTTQEIRTMLFAMRPVILETQGLLPALNQYADRLNATESFKVGVNNRGYNGQLSGEAEGVVFAIVEEAVGNAKKHAQASEIKVNLIAGKNSVTVEIRDNGVGFDVEETKSTYDQRTSLGLINLDERAQLVGGQSTIESARGKGTTIRVEIPFSRVTEEAR